jgi:hypothetical protein
MNLITAEDIEIETEEHRIQLSIVGLADSFDIVGEYRGGGEYEVVVWENDKTPLVSTWYHTFEEARKHIVRLAPDANWEELNW